MHPILVGYTNPTHEPDDQHPSRRRAVSLSEADCETHIHGVGASRSGKSKWLENFCRQLLRERRGFLLIDPQGALSQALASYIAYRRPAQPIIYFDPSRTDYLIPFNPFRPTGGEMSTRVSKQVEATIRAWGMENTNETPLLDQWLHCIFFLLSTGEFTLNNVSDLLQHSAKDLIGYATSVLGKYPAIQNEWQSLGNVRKPSDFDAQIGSAKRRLFRFLLAPNVKRMMSITERNLDFEEVFDRGITIIANLQESESFSREGARIVGTLLVNDLWTTAREKGHRFHTPYFLLVDEVQEFITPDIRDILDRGAGKGLHLGVFHQHLKQFEQQDPWSFASIRTNARTKLVFGGLTKEDALLMVDDLFVNQIPYDEIKFTIEQTKFWPVYMRDEVVTRARGGGAGAIATSGIGSGPVWDPTGQHFIDVQRTSTGEAESSLSTWQDAASDIPILYPVPYREVTSIQTYNLDEQRNRLADRLIEQYQRHYFIKKRGQGTVPAATPFVKEFRIFPKNEEQYILEHLIEPYALSVEEIDRKIAAQERALRGKVEALKNPPDPESYLEG